MSMILKCKMCGGDIEVNEDMTVGTCLFCGSTMTLPKIESDKKARLFNRANDYRLNNDFDKAYDAYRTIADEDEQESEAYWGMILSEYGVEYVEDPKSGKRIPTCHRTQVQSILDNTNYKLALRYSSGEQKLIYREEAEVLDKLQRQIIAVSSKVEPYDVFICYKETDDETGERTADSVLAQSIYDELEKQGIHTFFARVSLEEHLGENYEPFIYAALKSARVMLMVSTSGEHCDAVWVKNEWSRFLRFMEEDDSKALIPVYKDMNAYEFPNALSKFQAQDMGKVGAIQDMVRGIKKILGTTQTEKRDAVLSALLEDKQEREARKRKNKKIGLIAAIIILLAGIGIGIKVYTNWKEEERIRQEQEAQSRAAAEQAEKESREAAEQAAKESREAEELAERQQYYAKEIQKRVITTSQTIPDSSQYYKWVLPLAPGMDFSTYFEYVRVNECDILTSKVYQDGWVFVKAEGKLVNRPMVIVGEKTRLACTISFPDISVHTASQMKIKNDSKIANGSYVEVVFVSKEVVDTYELEDSRTVTLLSGEIIEDADKDNPDWKNYAMKSKFEENPYKQYPY